MGKWRIINPNKPIQIWKLCDWFKNMCIPLSHWHSRVSQSNYPTTIPSDKDEGMLFLFVFGSFSLKVSLMSPRILIQTIEKFCYLFSNIIKFLSLQIPPQIYIGISLKIQEILYHLCKFSRERKDPHSSTIFKFSLVSNQICLSKRKWTNRWFTNSPSLWQII